MSPHSTPNLSSLIDESARRRFECAWRDGQPQAIESFLPPPDDPCFPATLEELVHIDLEMRWKSGAAPGEQAPRPLEDYLAQFPRLQDPTALLRLVRQEIRCRSRRGDRPSVAEYRTRFPNIVPEDFEPTLASGPPGVDNDTAPIPGYEILGVLGRGGMGVVLKALQLSLNRVVALKRILGGAGTTPEDLTRFRGEAEAIARLQHANIVQVYEVGQVEGRPYFSLEYVDGGTLAQKLNGALQRRRADSGPTRQPRRTALALVPAQAGPAICWS